MHRQALAVSLALFVGAPSLVVAPRAQKAKDASLALRVSPQVSFSPSRVVATGELKDVDDASAEFYCPGLEWDWGDGTTSESSIDCEPFEAGRTEIKKRFISEHTFNIPGRFRVQLRLKRAKKVILASTSSCRCGPGSATDTATDRAGATFGYRLQATGDRPVRRLTPSGSQRVRAPGVKRLPRRRARLKTRQACSP